MSLGGISSDLICRVVGSYLDSSEDDYGRYLRIQDLLLSGGMLLSRSAREDDSYDQELELEEHKDKKLKGDKGVSEGVALMFRDILEDYLPGGYFKWEDYARKLSNNFYRMAYAQFKSIIPKMVSQKLNKLGIDRSEGSVELTSESLNKLIMDSLIHLHEHPDRLQSGLVRSYGSGGSAEGFFVPRVTSEVLKEREKEEGGSDVKVGDADDSVLDTLSRMKEDGESLTWKWKGIDEYGVLSFTLPDLYGSKRIFTMKLPSSIQTIRPGTYTFDIKDVKEGRGAVLGFKEQGDQLSSNVLESISDDGLGEDQLRKFINNGIINGYMSYLRSLPTEKLVEDFLGAFNVGPHSISSASDLAELIEMEGDSASSSKGRGAEKVKEKYEKSIEDQRAMLQAMISRWERAPEVAKHFMKATEDDGSRIVKLISSQFPMNMEGAPSLAGIFATSKVVSMVLRYIMSPHMPLAGGGKSMPWVHFAWDAFENMALRDSSIRSDVEKLIRYKRDKKDTSSVVSDADIVSFLEGQSSATVSKNFQRLRDSIGKVITNLHGAPELRKFFERRDIFRSYVAPQLEDALGRFIEEKGLSMDDAKDMKVIEKQRDKIIKGIVSRMQSKSASLVHHVMVRKSHLLRGTASVSV